MPLGHVLFGAQTALKHIDSISVCFAGRWTQTFTGGPATVQGRACLEQREDECSGAWSVNFQCLFLSGYVATLSFATINMMRLTDQCIGVLHKAGRDPERSFKVPLHPQDRIRSIRVALK